VIPEIVYRGVRQLILHAPAQHLRELHQALLLLELVRQVELEPPAQAVIRRLLQDITRLLVHAHVKVAARAVAVIRRVAVALLEQFLVDIQRLLVVPQVEGAVRDPRLRGLAALAVALLKLEHGEGARVIATLDKVAPLEAVLLLLRLSRRRRLPALRPRP
jgi:hypothetical protein